MKKSKGLGMNGIHVLMCPLLVLGLIISPLHILNAAIDLEDHPQDFVLDAFKLSIPGFEHAYNPSIVRYDGKLLLSFRITPNPKSLFESQIGLIWLDEELKPMGNPQILNMREGSNVPSRAEDARLICVGNRLYIIYDDNRDPVITRGGFRVYVAELRYDGESFCVLNIECLKNFEGESSQRREKSWVPFDYQGDLLLAYSLDPHLIFSPIFGTETCETVAASSRENRWKWGELRGGTPGLLIDEQYLAFFHSSITMASEQSGGELMQHYFIGAYTFMKDPPFALTKISPEPIIAKGFYSGQIYRYYWKPIRAVFPCGYLCEGQNIWIAYGRQDHEVWILKLDKQQLLDSLITVSE